MTPSLSAIAALLAGHGHVGWLVGAAARAFVLGKPLGPAAELVTDAPEAVALSVLATAGVVADVREISLQTLEARPLADWLAARGATLDAFAVDLRDGSLVDPFEGVPAATAGVLRSVLPPDLAYREDPILLLRVPRLMSTTGAVPTSEMRRYAVRDAGNLLDIRHRRAEWAAEFNAMLLGENLERALQHLLETRVLAITMPEVAAMVGFDKTCAVHHKDIWDHTKLVAQKAQPDLVVRWTALCHDIGKIWTRSVNKNGKVHFFRHEEHGALLFEGIAHRVGLGPELTRRVAYVIENHSRVNLYQDDWSDSAIRRLIRDTAGHLPDLVAFSKADFTTKREGRIAELKRQMADLEARLLRVQVEDARVAPLSKGIGTAIMIRFGLPPSRRIGELKAALELAIERGELPARADDELYLEWLSGQNLATLGAPGGS